MKKSNKVNINKSFAIEKLYRCFIYVLPGVLFFSYQPLIHFGSSESMNFEISLPLIWLVLFDLLVFAIMCRRRVFLKGLKYKWLWLLLPIWLSLSVLWSFNSLRGLLTVGILWLIYLAVYGFWGLRSLFLEVGFKEKFWKVFFGSTLVICGWCFLQCILDLAGVPREGSLMCAGCVSGMFGFPHPSGFAIEPQFMGNLLLAPAIVARWLWIKKRNADNTIGLPSLCSKLSMFCFFITSTLFLTFSRGAIYAFLVAMVVMTAWEVVNGRRNGGMRQKIERTLKMWVIIAVSFVFTLGIQGVMAELSPTNDTFQSGVGKVLNHLTLGVVDVRESAEPDEGSVVTSEEEVEPISGEEDDAEEAAFDGYVAESTNTRLRLTGAAIEVWRSDLATALVGVGLGGAGQALYVNGLSPAPKEIVQNQYASLLLETGIVGVILALFSLGLVVRAVWRSPWRIALISLLVAYGVSLLFFSGLPNALHIYLLPAVIYVMSFAKNNRVGEKSVANSKYKDCA